MATLKQKKLAKKITENPRMSVSAAMKSPDVGYSPSSAEKPQEVTNSKGFRAIFAETFTPEYLRKHHKQLMNLKTIHSISVSPELEEENLKQLFSSQGLTLLTLSKWTEFDKKGNEREKAMAMFVAPDGQSKKAALDMAYKLAGEYAPERLKVDRDLPVSDDELDAAIAEHEKAAERFKQYRKTKSKHKSKVK